MSEMVERVAKIIHDGIVGGNSSWEEIAADAIAAMKTPTEAMIMAGCAKANEEQCRPIAVHRQDAAGIYEAMIDAALAE